MAGASVARFSLHLTGIAYLVSGDPQWRTLTALDPYFSQIRVVRQDGHA